ncbi:MAG: SulP family inorganic anion transporter, partial [Propioniciclava sp.]
MRIPDHIRRHLVTLLPGRDDVRALPRTWRRDVLAGLTVGVVALPLALAFGVSSGMGAAAGLVTAIVAGVVAAVFGGSNVQVSGPTGAMAVILAPIVAAHGPHAVVVISILAGLILVAAGVLRLGRVAVYIPWPVIEGFTAGIAIIIALQQVPFALDVRTPAGHSPLVAAGEAISAARPPEALIALGMTVAVVVIIELLRAWRATFPGALLAVIAATLVAEASGLGIARIGE